MPLGALGSEETTKRDSRRFFLPTICAVSLFAASASYSPSAALTAT
jgi:hypothetical protein